MAIATNISKTDIKTPPGEKNRKGDPFIWGIYISLIIISMIECYSASSQEISGTGLTMYQPILKHLMMLFGGWILLFIIQRIHYKKLPPAILFFSFLTVVSMVTVLFVGDSINGAKRSFTLPGVGFSIQPAEMAKLSIVSLIAWITARNQMVKGVTNKGVLFCALAVIVYSACIFLQGLTNTLLLMGISFSMMLISGVQKRKILLVITSYAITGSLFFIIKHNNEEKQENLNNTEMVVTADGLPIAQDPTETNKVDRSGTWQQRMLRHFTGPDLVDQEMNSKNRQEMYSRIAQAHGGITGVGPGNSRECSRLPLAFSDYIYSIIIEELGLAGGVVVLLLYLFLLARAGMIAKKCSRAFPALLIMGMAVMITLQALFHMGINTGFFPVSGQPLPLISKGGTSILMISMAFGVMLSVSRYAVQSNKSKEVKAEINELPEELRGANPYQTE